MSGPVNEALSVLDKLAGRARAKKPIRWTASRKAAVVLAVAQGEITFDLVAHVFEISAEEFDSWTRRVKAAGLRGLSVTKVARAEQAVGQ